MRLLKRFLSPAAILAFCCSGAIGADRLYQPSVFAAPEPDVAACSYLTSDRCEPAACESACGGCNSCSSCSVCIPVFPCRCKGEPWTLQSMLTGDPGCCSITYGGWVSAGAYGNAYGAPNNGVIGMRDVGNEFTVNQVWGYMEKATHTGGCGWDWGFRADMLFGTDGQDTQAFGSLPLSPNAWDNRWDTSADYGSALPQLYAEVAVNDLKVKMGHFYTILGYEVVPATGNFFTSHSYSMYFGEPFTHTGVLAEYALFENLTVWGGWVQGWDTAFDNPRGSNDFLGGIRAPLLDAATLTWALDFGHDDLTGDDRFLQSIVVDVDVTQRLNYVLQSDWGQVKNVGSSEWYSVNNYLFYTINDCWKLGTRLEWFRDNDGVRMPPGGVPGEYWEVTCGVNWRPLANVVFRPELRYDWANGVGVAPFDGGAASDQFSGGFDLIVTF